MLDVAPAKPASPGQTLERAEGATQFKGEVAPVGMCVSNRPEAMAAAAQGLQPQPERKAKAVAEGTDSPSKHHSREAIGAAGFAYAPQACMGLQRPLDRWRPGPQIRNPHPARTARLRSSSAAVCQPRGCMATQGSAELEGPTAVRGRGTTAVQGPEAHGTPILRTGSARTARQRRSRSAARLIRQCPNFQGLLAWGRSVPQISRLRRHWSACVLGANGAHDLEAGSGMRSMASQQPQSCLPAQRLLHILQERLQDAAG